jgi:hypothetical protein
MCLILTNIECKYCGAIGQRKDIHKDGWILAKNDPFHYACIQCKHIDLKLLGVSDGN